MNLISSVRAFSKILSDDTQLARLGARRGDLLRLHYGGRWKSRRGVSPGLRQLNFSLRDRRVSLELTAAYEGAFLGVFLDGEYECARLLPATPKRILDLGANIGMAAIHLANQFPSAEFICVEPDPRNLPLLERNLRANGVQATTVAAAVGAASGTLNLRFGSNPTCSALESSPMHDLQETTPVVVRTVPELMAAAKWDQVDLVKIDIEGSEDELLSKGNEWLSSAGALILEIHPNTTEEKIAGYIKPHRLQLRRTSLGREPVYLALRD